MEDTKILEVLDGYAYFLKSWGTLPIRHDNEHQRPSLGERTLQHCYWMVLETKRFVLEGRKEKANRWLGFIQAILWLQGLYSLAELKNHNRP